MGNADGENVGIPQDFPNSSRKIGMEIGNEEHGGFRADFFSDFPHGNGCGRKGGERFEIIAERRYEATDFGMGKRGLEDSDPIPGIRDRPGTISRSYGARRNQLENRYRLIETGRALFSETHGRGHVDNAPDRDFAVWDEGFDEGLAAAQTRFPVYGACVVGFGIRTEPAEFDTFAGKDRSVLSRRKRHGVAEFGEVEKTHVRI